MTGVSAMLAELNAARVAAGQCRHCGGPVPCWSPFGDRAVGVKHGARAKLVQDSDGWRKR